MSRSNNRRHRDRRTGRFLENNVDNPQQRFARTSEGKEQFDEFVKRFLKVFCRKGNDFDWIPATYKEGPLVDIFQLCLSQDKKLPRCFWKRLRELLSSNGGPLYVASRRRVKERSGQYGKQIWVILGLRTPDPKDKTEMKDVSDFVQYACENRMLKNKSPCETLDAIKHQLQRYGLIVGQGQRKGYYGFPIGVGRRVRSDSSGAGDSERLAQTTADQDKNDQNEVNATVGGNGVERDCQQVFTSLDEPLLPTADEQIPNCDLHWAGLFAEITDQGEKDQNEINASIEEDGLEGDPQREVFPSEDGPLFSTPGDQILDGTFLSIPATPVLSSQPAVQVDKYTLPWSIYNEFYGEDSLPWLP